MCKPYSQDLRERVSDGRFRALRLIKLSRRFG
jgi:hypothetical protein